MNQRRPRTHRLAEDLFQNICSESGVVANRVEDDSNGWDFFVEYPAPPSDRPPDISEPGLSCLVQIKSTVTKGRTIQLKLSNALRFAKKPQPCFVVLLAFAADGRTLEAVFCRHFWKDEITAALRSVREAHAAGKEELNRLKFPIQFRAEDRTSPEKIVEGMEAVISSVPAPYEAEKVRFSGSVGYEDGVAKGKFSLPASATETLVDLMLGLAETVPITDFVVHENRFGIPDPKPLHSTGEAKLSVEVKPAGECSILATSPDGREQITLPAEIFVPAIPDLPEELLKFRIKAPCIDLVLRPSGEGTITAGFDPAEMMPIELLDNVVRFWSWLPDGEVGIEAMHEGKTLFYGSCESNASDPSSYWKRLAYGTKALAELVPASRRPTGLMLSALVAMEHLKLLYEFAVMLSESGTTVRLGVGEGTDMDAIRASTRFMLPVYLELGGFLFFAATLNDISEVEVEGVNVTFRLRNPVVHRSCVLVGTADENRRILKAEIARGRDTCPGGVTGLVHTDFPDEDAQPEAG